MLIQEPMLPEETKAGEKPKKRFWLNHLETWTDWDGAGEGAYIQPGKPMVWRRDDPHMMAAMAEYDENADRRVVEAVRQRALRGEAQAMGVSYRAARGMARPVDRSPTEPEFMPMAPEVSEAMLQAGFRAMGMDPSDQSTWPDLPPNRPR